jgi:tetraacyldisaccharide 4'-kinase
MIKLVYPKFWLKDHILSYLLLPFSLVYMCLQIIRRIFAHPIRLEAKVICVGNVTVGGTGKTQIVLWLARQLLEKKHKVLVVTKGYGSNLKGAKIVTKSDLASDVGDESVLLRECAEVLAAKSIEAALPLIKEIAPEIIIFDDGLQNPNFIKDFNILVIDADRGFGNGKIMPAGPMREIFDLALYRSDIVITVGNPDSCNLSLNFLLQDIHKPHFRGVIKLVSKLDQKKEYYAFSAIGNPDRFYKSLCQKGLKVIETKSFPDHHNYTTEEIQELKTYAKKHKYNLITTVKDYTKIADQDGIICTKIDLEFDQEKKLMDAILKRSCS